MDLAALVPLVAGPCGALVMCMLWIRTLREDCAQARVDLVAERAELDRIRQQQEKFLAALLAAASKADSSPGERP